MALETEIKLSLPPRAAARLAKHPLLAGILPLRQKLLNTYYDTPDRRLQRERVAVRYRRKGRQWLFTVKSAAPSAGGLACRNEWEAPGEPGEFDFTQVDDAKLRKRLEALRSDLAPAFTTDFTRSAWLLEPQAGVRIELALDRGWIEAAGRRQAICEVELELISGEVGALFAAALALQADLPLHPEAPSKAERGYRLFADARPAPVKARPTVLDRRMSPAAAFRAVALNCIAHLQGNEQGVRESDAPEFIHQARVAIRRLRSAIRVWHAELPADFVAAFDARWRTLATTLGEARNRDVFLTETLPALRESGAERSTLDRLSRDAHRRSASSHRQARRALGASDYSRLLLEFTAAVLALPERSAAPLEPFARHCLEKRAKRVAERARESRHADAAARHRLRIALKRLRYALEFFAPLYPDHQLQAHHQAASGLQDILGRMNDLEVAGQFIAAALPDKRSAPLLAELARRNEEMANELAPRLKAFLQQALPWQHR